MIKIKYESNLQEKMAVIAALHKQLAESRHVALRKEGYEIRDAMSKHVLSDGESSWNQLHPLTRGFSKKFNASTSLINRSFLRKVFHSPYRFLANLSRFRLRDKNKTLEMGYGNEHERFTKSAEDAGEIAENGMVISLSAKAKKMIAASTDGKFSFRKTTNSLRIPKRPIMQPVFMKEKGKIFPRFSQRFGDDLQSRFNE